MQRIAKEHGAVCLSASCRFTMSGSYEPLWMDLPAGDILNYGIRAVLAIAAIKILANVIEWLRVQWLLSKLPRGPRWSNLLLGNTGAASKVLFNAHHCCAELHLACSQSISIRVLALLRGPMWQSAECRPTLGGTVPWLMSTAGSSPFASCM